MVEIFASKTAEIEEREVLHADISRKLAGECMVLLENDGALPIHTKKVALFGNGARATIKGGTGSGDVNTRNNVNIEQGFQNAGIEVTTTAWLDRQEKRTRAAKEAYVQWMKEETARKHISEVAVMFDQPYKEPDCEIITTNDIDVSETDTAVYVIARNSGEGADRFDEEGDYRLYPHERGNIHLLAEVYDKLIVVLNIGGVMDLSEMRSIAGVNAILLMTQLGNLGGDALLDVLTGKVNPSGKTTDTWAENYMDYPSSAKFSHNESVHDEMYEDGIYVGYRYFDSFGVKPLYCFGYGKSYTDFEIKAGKISVEGNEIQIPVTVKNTGKIYAGKEVVQVYYSAAGGVMEKPYQELAAYQKTKLLAPGETEEIVLKYQAEQMASYSEKEAAWILEKGDYIIRVGNSSASTKVAGVIEVCEDIQTLKAKNLFALDVALNEIHPDAVKLEEKKKEAAGYQAEKVIFDTTAIAQKTVVYQGMRKEYHTDKTEKITMQDILSEKATVEELVAQLLTEELAEFCAHYSLLPYRVLLYSTLYSKGNDYLQNFVLFQSPEK